MTWNEIDIDIEEKAATDSGYAIAYALLRVANALHFQTEATEGQVNAIQSLAHAVEVVVGAELAGIGISIRDRI